MSAKTALTPDVPWPGAAAYGTEDRAYFHGRKRETEELLRLIQRDVLTLVSGAAGVGKTSLIQAGLLPALAESSWLPIVPKFDWSATPPNSEAPDLNPAVPLTLANPLSRTLIDTLLATAAERSFTSSAPQAGETLWEYFHRIGNRWWSARQRVVTPIVIIDGFESVFTTAMENATAQRQSAEFLKELSQLVANRPPQRLATRLENGVVSETAYDFDPIPLRIVFVIRDEFASQLPRLLPLFPTLRRSELRVEPFSTSQARDVLVRGAIQASLMTDATLDAVVAQLASGRTSASQISPAKLSTMARALALARKERGTATITPDFLPPPNHNSVPRAEASVSPVTETNELRKELTASEKRRRTSQRLALAAVLTALAAVAAPLVRDQFAPAKLTAVNTAPAAFRHEEVPSPSPATPLPADQSAPFESPFTIETPEFLPAVPTKAASVTLAPDAHPQSDETVTPNHTPASAPIEPAVPPATPTPAPNPPTPVSTPSALSPDAQRQIDAAAADRKEQQRRDFLRRQQESHRPKEPAPR
jgi:hypothetical protein